MPALLLLCFGFLISASAFASSLCQNWSDPQRVGTLETKFVNEASGFAVSRQFADRFYFVNDSGDGPFFYVTNAQGQQTQKVQFSDLWPNDIEEAAVGPCGGIQCLFVGDIGDNSRKFDSHNLWLIPEQAVYPGRVEGKQLKLVYPAGRRFNAEAMAVHPVTGDFYLLTKEEDFKERRAGKASLFRVSSEAMANAANGAQLEMQFVATIDLPWTNYDFGMFGQIATGMSFNSDGSKALILSYENVLEVKMEKLLSSDTRSWKGEQKEWLDNDYSVKRLYGLLSQMETVSYSQDGRSFFLTSEFNPDFGDKEAPILRFDCQD